MLTMSSHQDTISISHALGLLAGGQVVSEAAAEASNASMKLRLLERLRLRQAMQA